MPSTVTFYLLKENSLDDCLKFACQLIEKNFTAGKQMYAQTPSREDTIKLDDFLWTFHDISFLPHEMYINSTILPKTNILISDNLAPPPAFNQAALLFNLTENIPDYWRNFAELFEIVPNDEKSRLKAREKFKLYRQEKAVLKYLDMTKTLSDAT